MPENNRNNQLFQPGAGSDYAQRMRLERTKERAAQTPSMGVLVAKCIFGIGFMILFFLINPSGSTPRILFILIGLVIGLALILWGILGYRQQIRRIEDAKAELVSLQPLETFGNQELQELAEKYDKS